MNVPVINIAFGGIAKVLVNNFLVSNPSVHINGAPVGTAICYLIYMSLNLVYVKKITKADINISFWVKPLLSGAVMGVVAFFIYALTGPVFGDSKIGLILSLAVSGGISGIAYLMSLLCTSGITRDDIKMLPKGEKIADILCRMKLMK